MGKSEEVFRTYLYSKLSKILKLHSGSVINYLRLASSFEAGTFLTIATELVLLLWVTDLGFLADTL